MGRIGWVLLLATGFAGCICGFPEGGPPRGDVVEIRSQGVRGAVTGRYGRKYYRVQFRDQKDRIRVHYILLDDMTTVPPSLPQLTPPYSAKEARNK